MICTATSTSVTINVSPSTSSPESTSTTTNVSMSSSSAGEGASDHHPQNQNQKQQQNQHETEVQSLLSHLSEHFIAASRHHLSLGALHFQRCSYRSSTEHYQRSINFLMRREDALNRYSPTDITHNRQQQEVIKEELAGQIEKMEFYTYVLRLNNAADMDLLRNRPTIDITSTTTGINNTTGTTTGKRPLRMSLRLLLPPPRLAFYLDEHHTSHILDSHLRARPVSLSSPTSTQQQETTRSTVHLLKAYVMYNLALCHVALGSYPESLNLLRMVREDGLDTTAQEPTPPRPAELAEIMVQYQRFVEDIIAANNGTAQSQSCSKLSQRQMDMMDFENEEEGDGNSATDGVCAPSAA